MSTMPQAVVSVSRDPKGRDPKAVAAVVGELAARFGNRLVTSQAVREQHGNTTTWIANEPPDAVVFPQDTADVQEKIDQVIAGGRVGPTSFLEPVRSIKERIVLLGCSRDEPDSPQTIRGTQLGRRHIEVVIP